MIVHWSGRPCELDKIKKICNKYKLKLIQDSCHAIDAKFKGKVLFLMGIFALTVCIHLKT